MSVPPWLKPKCAWLKARPVDYLKQADGADLAWSAPQVSGPTITRVRDWLVGIAQ